MPLSGNAFLQKKLVPSIGDSIRLHHYISKRMRLTQVIAAPIEILSICHKPLRAERQPVLHLHMYWRMLKQSSRCYILRKRIT